MAESFRAEIYSRFEAHNVAYRAREAAELETVLREHPEERGQPGFEVRDSGAWEVYQASEIRIDHNAVTIVLPRACPVTLDLVFLFDHTTVAWTAPLIGAAIVDGEPRSALARASMMHHQGHLTARQLAEVRRKIHRVWPSIEVEATF